MNIAPGHDHTTPGGQKFDVNRNRFITLVICYEFLPFNDFLTFSLKKCTFSHTKAQGSKNAVKMLRSTQVHHLNKLYRARVTDAVYQI